MNRHNAGRSEKERVEVAMDKLSVNFGLEILKIVPGYVSTEVDARLSYDTEATVAKGRSIVALYKAAGEDARGRKGVGGEGWVEGGLGGKTVSISH